MALFEWESGECNLSARTARECRSEPRCSNGSGERAVFGAESSREMGREALRLMVSISKGAFGWSRQPLRVTWVTAVGCVVGSVGNKCLERKRRAQKQVRTARNALRNVQVMISCHSPNTRKEGNTWPKLTRIWPSAKQNSFCDFAAPNRYDASLADRPSDGANATQADRTGATLLRKRTGNSVAAPRQVSRLGVYGRSAAMVEQCLIVICCRQRLSESATPARPRAAPSRHGHQPDRLGTGPRCKAEPCDGNPSVNKRQKDKSRQTSSATRTRGASNAATTARTVRPANRASTRPSPTSCPVRSRRRTSRERIVCDARCFGC